MLFSDLGALLLPDWLLEWIRHELVPALGFRPRQLLLGLVKGVADTTLLFMLGVTVVVSGRQYMQAQYSFPVKIQERVVRWAVVSDLIARQADIPREVPLVLWYKENSMEASNPANCTGIIGAYDLVRSGAMPCFTPGRLNDIEVAEQLALGAAEFKKRCPEISYRSHDPELIKRCYFAYNAGTGAAARLDANESAYVMNNFDETRRNMVYADVELGTVRVTSMGAWPTHLAFQSIIVSQLDVARVPPALPFLDSSSRIWDWAVDQVLTLREWANGAGWDDGKTMDRPRVRSVAGALFCIGEGSKTGQAALRPRLNPVTESPVLTQDIHGCSYNLPGLDITSGNARAILQAPMPGSLTTYTDQWYNTTIRIENEEWIVWLLHPRSYTIIEGDVRRGDRVGVMGAVGYATGPHVHYTIFDKVNGMFVDPSLYIP